MKTSEPQITYDKSRDDYGRTVHWVRPANYPAEGLIGSITLLPKRTFPVTAYMVNDFRITRQPNRRDEIKLVGSLDEAKAMFPMSTSQQPQQASYSLQCPSVKPGTEITCQRNAGHTGLHGRSMDEYSKVRWSDAS